MAPEPPGRPLMTPRLIRQSGAEVLGDQVDVGAMSGTLVLEGKRARSVQASAGFSG